METFLVELARTFLIILVYEGTRWVLKRLFG